MNDKFYLLHFIVNDTLACIELKYISQALPLMKVKPIPNCPPYCVGLINLAGQSIPMIDLATRIGLKRYKPFSVTNPILLCTDENHQIGLVVDEIIGLIDASTLAIQMRNDFDSNLSFFTATITIENSLVLLINMQHIFNSKLTRD